MIVTVTTSSTENMNFICPSATFIKQDNGEEHFLKSPSPVPLILQLPLSGSLISFLCMHTPFQLQAIHPLLLLFSHSPSQSSGYIEKHPRVLHSICEWAPLYTKHDKSLLCPRTTFLRSFVVYRSAERLLLILLRCIWETATNAKPQLRTSVCSLLYTPISITTFIAFLHKRQQPPPSDRSRTLLADQIIIPGLIFRHRSLRCILLGELNPSFGRCWCEKTRSEGFAVN